MKKKYSVNDNNQLLISVPKIEKPILADGRFSTDNKNRLSYWLNEPQSWRRHFRLPGKVSFQGNWQLNSDYDLELNLDKVDGNFRREYLVLKGEIISINGDTLVFQINSQDERGLSHIQLLKLKGCLQSDGFNRIIFLVDKKASPDILTFEGSWQINKNQQIEYTYEKTLLKRRAKVTYILTFEGFWQIDAANRLTYILEHSTKSRFDFRVQLESPSIYPQEKTIKYRIGFGFKKEKFTENKIISIYGTWKFSRKANLIFQVDYGKGRIKEIEFGTSIFLSRKDEVIFSLNNKEGEDLGICITFTHKFLHKNAGDAFLKLKMNRKESAFEAGVRIPF